MQDLRVIGVEDGALLLTSDDGAQFRLAVDDTVQARLRQAVPAPGTARKLAPRQIQAHIRSGMSAQDVAELTGVPLEHIQRFEGPVIAEREYVIESALAVPVHTAMDADPIGSAATFGTAILSRLRSLNASGERWASWKEEDSGWIVKLSFTADQVDHDARWRFEPKKSALAPLNGDAEMLSRQGEASGGLIPRLRAVDGRDRAPDTSRFDSGAFVEGELGPAAQDTAPHLEAVPYGRVGAEQTEQRPSNQTADLLEALRRRRGERESAHYDELQEARADHPSTGSIRLVDVPLPVVEEKQRTTAPQDVHQKPAKKGRATMPSWDEIVFGARSDDDPA